MQCIAFVIAPHCIKKAIPFRKKSGMAEGVKERSKNSEFRFLPFLVSSVSAAFRPFRCHFVKSHQSNSPLCSFFNFQKYTQKKNENQRDIIFRTSLISSVLYGQLSYLVMIFFPFTMWMPFFRPSVVPFSLIIFPSMLYTPLTFVLASSTPAMPVALP